MISEEQLRLTAQQAGRVLADSLPEPEDCHHTFSPEFERKMKRLIRKHKYQGFYRGLKRVACIILVFFLCGGTFLAVNAEARGKLFGWVSQQVEAAQLYFFAGHSNESAANIHYTLPVVPEGYEMWDSTEEDNGWTTLYANEEEELLDFGYRREQPEGMSVSLYFMTGDMRKTTLTVCDMPAEYYQDDTGEIADLIVWVDPETDTLFYISGYLDKEQLVELAESVVPEEK